MQKLHNFYIAIPTIALDIDKCKWTINFYRISKHKYQSLSFFHNFISGFFSKKKKDYLD